MTIKAKTKLTVVTLRLSKNQIKQLDEIAKHMSSLNEREFSRSEILRKAVDAYMQNFK